MMRLGLLIGLISVAIACKDKEGRLWEPGDSYIDEPYEYRCVASKDENNQINDVKAIIIGCITNAGTRISIGQSKQEGAATYKCTQDSNGNVALTGIL
ncbi:hypothetical protein WR25_23095 [Diploscapter pachys]|uniref:Abnormal cell migration protein 18-like fibronectin type I domain-containing protein n=1 Tax=Diploscapter pachys TaxID=2018661 RepID=A0A2A2LKX3_9BILA|nr:hypothetical protein WR25_23095 [Diploscapter pachys]